MPDDTSFTATTAGTDGHPDGDRLRAYLDETLPADDATLIADHLERCGACVSALDDLEEPVTLLDEPDAEAPAWDEGRMRRAVRRTLLRTAVNAIVMVVVAALVLQVVGWFVVDPLLIDRGERVSNSVIASIDLPVITIPGAEIDGVNSNFRLMRRHTEVRAQRTVGSQTVSLGGYTTRLGPLGMSTDNDSFITAEGPLLRSTTLTPFEPERHGDGTAVTVELTWLDGLPPAEADSVTDAAEDLALLWVGFRLPDGDPVDPLWRLGYSACGNVSAFIPQQTWGGFGSGGGFRVPSSGSSGSRHALEELRRATANLADIGWLDNEQISVGPLADVAATARWLATNEPDVASIVITGPTSAVAAAVEATAPDEATVLEVDFDRGAPEPCG
jgi:hypothetical protein